MTATNLSKSVLISGSIAYDRIMNFPGNFKDHIMPEKVHVINLSFQVTTLEEKFGGTAGNIAYSLKLLGHEPKIISAVGNDFAPYRQHFDAVGIDTTGLKVIPEMPTAFVVMITDLTDNQIAAFYAGALEQAPVESEIPLDVELAIIAPESKDNMIKRADLYRKKGLPFIFDPGQQIISLTGNELRGCLEGAKMVIGNDYEIALLSRKTALTIDELRQKVEILVITYGEAGSMIYSGAKETKVAAVKPTKMIDPTGAGDAYRAGFIAGLLEGRSLLDCGALASWTAAQAIACYGAQEHRFQRSDFEASVKPTEQL